MATNKFKFKLKITGFELEVEGSKEDVAAITSTISNQLKGLTSPPIIGDSSFTEDVESEEVPQQQQSLPPTPKKKVSRKVKSNTQTTPKGVNGDAVDFKNDPTKYSSPTLSWKTLQKATWVLYVIYQEKQIQELTIAQIVETFNKHFRQARTPRASNVGRDFGKAKLGSKPLVQENNTVSPATWYLTSEGESFVQNLIKESKS